MNIHKENIPININGEKVMVSLKWMRGANRWNNGATRYGNKYLFKVIISREKQKDYLRSFNSYNAVSNYNDIA